MIAVCLHIQRCYASLSQSRGLHQRSGLGNDFIGKAHFRNIIAINISLIVAFIVFIIVWDFDLHLCCHGYVCTSIDITSIVRVFDNDSYSNNDNNYEISSIYDLFFIRSYFIFYTAIITITTKRVIMSMTE